jgi:Cu/Zn superoxide dismutase
MLCSFLHQDPSKYGYSAGATSSSVLTTNPVSAIAVIRNTQLYTAGTIFGTAQFGFDSTTGKVRVVLSATGLPPNSAHGFHIHTYGDDTDGKGTNAGTHFSPIAGATHQLPPSPTRHVGDMVRQGGQKGRNN